MRCMKEYISFIIKAINKLTLLSGSIYRSILVNTLFLDNYQAQEATAAATATAAAATTKVIK